MIKRFFRHKQATASAVSRRVLLPGGKRVTARDVAGKGVVVAIRARAVDILDDPTQQGVPRSRRERAPCKGAGDMVAGRELDALGLPLAIGDPDRLGEGCLVGVGAGRENLFEPPAQRVDDGGRELRGQIVELGQLGGAGVSSWPREEFMKAAPALAAWSSKGRPALAKRAAWGVSLRKDLGRGRLAAHIAQLVQQVVLLVLQRPLQAPGTTPRCADGLVRRWRASSSSDRRLKRALQDEQNDLLDKLRNVRSQPTAARSFRSETPTRPALPRPAGPCSTMPPRPGRLHELLPRPGRHARFHRAAELDDLAL